MTSVIDMRLYVILNVIDISLGGLEVFFIYVINFIWLNDFFITMTIVLSFNVT